MFEYHQGGPEPHTWQGAEELEGLLPPHRLISSRGSIDRYGFLHVLSQLCGMKRQLRPFAEWVHGWIWDQHPTVESLAFASLLRSVPVVVGNSIECEVLKSAGFREVLIGGLPFGYIERQHNSRNNHALLAYPPHSAEVERLSGQQENYMDYLHSIRHKFDGIFVSIFYLDWGGPMHKAAEARGLNVIQGARPDDANSLYRTRAMLDSFKHVTSNTMGSHFVYALRAGCCFSFSGPIFQYEEEMYLGNGNANKHSQACVKRLMEIQSEVYLRGRFGRFFVDHPSDGVVDEVYGEDEVGVRDVLSEANIRRILGWTTTGQLRGYSRGASNRTRRLLQKKL